jgi:hypothetical protein
MGVRPVSLRSLICKFVISKGTSQANIPSTACRNGWVECRGLQTVNITVDDGDDNQRMRRDFREIVPEELVPSSYTVTLRFMNTVQSTRDVYYLPPLPQITLVQYSHY